MAWPPRADPLTCWYTPEIKESQFLITLLTITGKFNLKKPQVFPGFLGKTLGFSGFLKNLPADFFKKLRFLRTLWLKEKKISLNVRRAIKRLKEK